jgi:uncharacterized protein YhaN
VNNARRKMINEALGKISDALSDLRAAADEEQEYYDNMPESLQQGDRGSAAEDAASNLNQACDDIENAISVAEEALS